MTPAWFVDSDDCFYGRLGLRLSLGFSLGCGGNSRSVFRFCFGLLRFSFSRLFFLVGVFALVAFSACAGDKVSACFLLVADGGSSGDGGTRVELLVECGAVAVLSGTTDV